MNKRLTLNLNVEKQIHPQSNKLNILDNEFNWWHDCDPGFDDAMAIMMGLFNDHKQNLVAISSCSGNCNINQTTNNVARILIMYNNQIQNYNSKQVDKQIILKHIHLYKASNANNGQQSEEFKESDSVEFFGSDGLNDKFELLDHKYSEKLLSDTNLNADQALNHQTSLYKNKINIFASGPLTNISNSIKSNPSFINDINRMVWMGGCFKGTGNITSNAEFNAHTDVEAVDTVLRSMRENNKKLEIVTWECTLVWQFNHNLLKFKVDDIDEFDLESCENSIFKFQMGLFDIAKSISTKYYSNIKCDGIPMILCDAIAQFVCQNPNYKKVSMSVDICTDKNDEMQGCLIPNDGIPNVEIVLEINQESFIKDLNQIYNNNAENLQDTFININQSNQEFSKQKINSVEELQQIQNKIMN